MTLIHRRIIYSVFIVIFLVVAPIIVLRISGYQYNFKKHDWQKTGMLFLETKPEAVNVYLNDQLVSEKTPLRIKDLLPNKYTLRVEKDGWGKWEKEIEINEGQTNTIQYVRIFRDKEMPKMVFRGEILKSAISPDRSKILILKKDESEEKALSIVDLTDGSETEIKKITGEGIEKIEFVDSGARAAIFSKNNLQLISLNGSAMEVNLAQQLNNKKITNIKLPTDNSENAYYVNSGQLLKYNWLLKKEEIVLPNSPLDYLPSGGKIYFLSNEVLSSISFQVLDTENKKEPDSLAFWERADYKMLEVQGQFLMAKKDKDLLVVDLLNNRNEIVRGGQYAKWSDSQTEMIFGDNYELWVYRPLEKNDKYIILTRSGSSIGASEWYPPESHVFYAEDGKIKILENLGNNRQAVELGQFDKIKEIFINKKGDKMFFIGEVAKTGGLYQLDIQ